ncbi:hypothetical protein F383_30991 [Gossypium arboreum]|uniref:Uncharacterized protein n=1 Tax=Gossypium arboreum TaxID=29729 RepID=A0A0B0PIS9_GOSAR|nr:hypothetical protein F383_30991 [Gossypium arboreum]
MSGIWHRRDMCYYIRPYLGYNISVICDPCKTMVGL